MIYEKNVKRYCRDELAKIENYEKAIADKTQVWVCHHRLELTLDGEFALSRDQLKMHDMYYNRPYYELIFLTPTEHRRLHNMNMSEESRRKISEAKKNMSEDTRRKLSIAAKHRSPISEESRRKMSEAKKGRTSNRKGKHHSEESRRKMSEAQKLRRARERKSISHHVPA